MITMKMTRVILKDSRFLGTTKRDGEGARVSAALTFLQVAARAAAAVGGEKFERSRGRELRAGRDPPSASRLQHEVQLGHLLQGEVLGVKSPQSIRFDEASLFIRGQDSVKDNLLRFIQ